MMAKQQMANGEKLARGLGWFSIGLGLAEALAPREFARLIGMEDDASNQRLLRLYGLREIMAGVGILSRRKPTGWLWARVGGDALDLATLGMAANARGANRERLGLAAAAVGGVVVLDVAAALQVGASDEPVTTVEKAISVFGRPEEIERFWRDPQNLKQVFKDFADVTAVGDNRVRFTIHAPLRQSLTWDSEIVDSRPGEMLRWQSLPDADLANDMTLTLHPAPAGRGIEVSLVVRFEPPKGALSHLPGIIPDTLASKVLRNFKSLFETGEIPTLDHNPSGREKPDANPPLLAGMRG